jgi:hypothetical protein
MKSSIIIEVLRVEKVLNADGEIVEKFSLVETFDYTDGHSTADIAEQARLFCETLNQDHGNRYRRYITSRKD